MKDFKVLFPELTEGQRKQLLRLVLEALPFRVGGAQMGRNYWTGVAKGNNDTLDEATKNLERLLG